MSSTGTHSRQFPRKFREFLKENVGLSQYTSLRLGGPSRYYAEPRSIEELGALVRYCGETAIPIRFLGGGSNSLVPDAGFAGIVVRLRAPEFTHLAISSDGICAGAGLKLAKALSMTVRKGRGGLEKLTGIPGTIAGALCGNAGTQLGDIGSMVSAVAVMGPDGRPSWREKSMLAFGYRESNLRGTIIVGCKLHLVEENPEKLRRVSRKLWQQKKSSQPYGQANAGCIFKNANGVGAGWLIEQAGLKGVKIGGAHVSERHANFIVAAAGATSCDVLRLIDHIREVVAKMFNLDLETEIDIW